jgi:ATP adenylyltransferase
MERLWSPWRYKYINSFKDENNTESDCFFCDAVKSGTSTESNLMVYFGEFCIVIMNKFPYNNGHLLIAPKSHKSDINNLSDEELFEIIKLQQISTIVLNEIYKPHGFNIGANLGRAAGAGVPGHLHYHILPRWNGDTNFLPIIAETKVLSESIEDSFHKISECFKAHLK